MVERTTYVDGEPCWVDVIAHDPEAARGFYAAVLGWTYEVGGPESGGYTMCSAAGRSVAGMTPPSPGSQMPAAWNLYFASADVDAVAGRVTGAGGKIVVGPMEVGEPGRMLAALDTAGTMFGVWQGARHPGFGQISEPGGFAWAELHTREPGVDAFYRDVFGYEQQQIGDGESFDYTVWSVGGTNVCGRMAVGTDQAGADPASTDPAGSPQQWLVYFAVDDADAAVERVEATDGRVVERPCDSPYGRFAIVTDPEGAPFAVIDLSRAAAG